MLLPVHTREGTVVYFSIPASDWTTVEQWGRTTVPSAGYVDTMAGMIDVGRICDCWVVEGKAVVLPHPELFEGPINKDRVESKRGAIDAAPSVVPVRLFTSSTLSSSIYKHSYRFADKHFAWLLFNEVMLLIFVVA
jgi:hypothetical protein